MNTEFDGAGFEKLAEVVAKASHGPYRLELGTIIDRNHEVVSEFACPDDARAILALLTLRLELIELVRWALKVAAIRNPENGPELAKAAGEFCEAAAIWSETNKPVTEPEA